MGAGVDGGTSKSPDRRPMLHRGKSSRWCEKPAPLAAKSHAWRQIPSISATFCRVITWQDGPPQPIACDPPADVVMRPPWYARAMPENDQSQLDTPDIAGFTRKVAWESRAARRARQPVFASSLSRVTLENRVLGALWPWDYREYPGRSRLWAWLIGMANVNSARVYRAGVRMPRSRWGMLASRLRGKAAELIALADECEKFARSRAEPSRNNITRNKVAPPSE